MSTSRSRYCAVNGMGRRLGVSLSGWIGWLLLRVLSLVDLRWIEDGGFFWTRVEGRGPCHKDQRPPKYPPPYPRPHCSHFPRTSAWEPSSACLLPAILVPCVGLFNWSFFFYYLSSSRSDLSLESQVSTTACEPSLVGFLRLIVAILARSRSPVLTLSQAASPLRLVRQQCAFEPEVQYAPPSSLSSSAVLHLSSPLSSLFLHDTSSRQLALLAPSLLRRHRPASRLHRGSVRCCRGRQNPTPAARCPPCQGTSMTFDMRAGQL